MPKKVGEILVDKGLISSDELKAALEEARKTNELLGKVLIRLEFITEEDLLKALGEQLDLEFVPTLDNVTISKEAVEAIPAKLAQQYKVMPLKLKDRILTIAVSDPLAVWFVDDLKMHSGFTIDRILTIESEITSAIKQHYNLGATIEDLLKGDSEDSG